MNVRVSGVVMKGNRILLIRHDIPKGQLWHVPGGSVREYETLTTALERELLEELDITIEVGPLWLVCDSIRPNDNVRVLHCIFVVKQDDLLEPSIQKENTSGIECRWVPVTESPMMNLYPNVGSYLEKLATTLPEIPLVKYIGYVDNEPRLSSEVKD